MKNYVVSSLDIGPGRLDQMEKNHTTWNFYFHDLFVAMAAIPTTMVVRGVSGAEAKSKMLEVGEGEEFAWGQFHTVLEGLGGGGGNDAQGNGAARAGGTIRMVDFSYRFPLAAGEWVVREFTCAGYPSGFVLLHSGEDVQGILDRAKDVGISNDQGHADQRIMYINRYDWSGHHNPHWHEHLGIDDPSGDDLSDWQTMEDQGRVIFFRTASSDLPDVVTPRDLLAANLSTGHGTSSSFFEQLKRSTGISQIVARLPQDEPEPEKEEEEKEVVLGIQVRTPGFVEYELAWAVFDDVPSNPDRRLVAFVYDSAYSALEGPLAAVP